MLNYNFEKKYFLKQTLTNYAQLMKFTLSFTVVFTCVICYMLAPKVMAYDWTMILLLTFAGLCITGSANAINQAVEKDTDAQMKRTANRPVASGKMSVQTAYTFATITGILGIFIMWKYFNFSSALLSAFSLFLYAFIYTPLKKINSIAVLVGAFPGALPCLIGWVAGNDDFAFAGLSLFLIQFLWQFPHFWAIAWVGYDDYMKAGYKLLPSSEGRTKASALQNIIYILALIPISLLPYFFKQTGIVSAIIVTVCGFVFLYQSINLFQKFPPNLQPQRM